MVSIITSTIRDIMLDGVFENYSTQLWNEKELIIIINNDNMDIEKWREKACHYENVSIFQLPEKKTLGECLNFGIEKAKYDIVAKFDDDDFYSPYYLTEVMDAFQKHNVQLVGKGSSYIYLEEEQLLGISRVGNENKSGKSFLRGGTLVFRKNIYPKIKFPSINGAGTDLHFVNMCKRKNIRIYTTSKYNYVYIRRSDENHSHTWKQKNEYFKSNIKVIGKTVDFKKNVTRRIGSDL